MDLLKIITGLLSTAYKLTDGEIATLLESSEENTEDKVLTILTQKDIQRVADIKKATDTEGKFQEGYKKAKKEVLTDLETNLKTKFGIQSDKTGLELIETIVAEKETIAGKGKAQLTDDDVKKHPVYQLLETKISTTAAEHAQALQAIKDEQKKAETFAVVKSKALSVLDGLKPVKSQNADVATNIQNLFLSSFDGYEFDTTNPDRTVVLKDGRVVEDNHGHSMVLEELVKANAAKFFEFEKNNGGSNGGDNQQQRQQAGAGGVGYPAGVNKPKNIEELTKLTNDETLTGEAKLIIIDTYEKEFGK